MASVPTHARRIRECQTMLNKILQSSPESSDSLGVVRRIIRCDECSSREAAVCSLELRFFCMDHFVDHCYRRLGEFEKAFSGSSRQEVGRSSVRECATRAAKLLLVGQELPNADRARLFDIILWSNELFYRSISRFPPGCEEVISGAEGGGASLCRRFSGRL